MPSSGSDTTPPVDSQPSELDHDSQGPADKSDGDGSSLIDGDAQGQPGSPDSAGKLEEDAGEEAGE
jgi:hypothetical protein